MAKKIVSILLSLMLILSLTACSGKLTKIDWAGENLCIAVDVDNYNGDILESGNYHFEVDTVPPNGFAPTYGIYVSDNPNHSLASLSEDELVDYVGGFTYEANSFDFDLTSGTYVYIVRTETAVETTGILHITMNK